MKPVFSPLALTLCRLGSLMSFVEVVRLDWKQTKSITVCVLWSRRKMASHSHNTSRKGNSTSVGDAQ